MKKNRSAIKITAISIISFVCAWYSVDLKAQDSNVIYSEIYSYNFTSAFQLLKNNSFEEKKKAALWVNYYWWLAISGENETENFAQCNIWLKKLESALEITTAKNNEYMFYKVMLHAYQSRLAMFYKNYLKAGLNLHYCNNELKTSIQKIEEFDKFYFSSGLYYYFVEKSLTDYPILYAYLAFFPKGNKNIGIKYLNKATENSDVMVKTEALYFLMRIYLEFEKNNSLALFYVEKLIDLYPKNLAFRYYKIQILKNTGNKSKSKQEFEQMQMLASNNLSLSEVQKNHFSLILKNDQQIVIQ